MDAVSEVDLEHRLAKERFGGNIPTWQEGNLNGIPVMATEDENNFYYMRSSDTWGMRKGHIFVQRKNGAPSERVPYCFGCEVPARVSTAIVPVWDGIPGGCAGYGRTEAIYNLHCEGCDGKKEDLKEIVIK